MTWSHDPHCDHKASAAVVTLAQARLGTARVFAYPMWRWPLLEDREVGAAPTRHRFDVTAHLPAQAAAIEAHRTQSTHLISDAPDAFRLEPGMLAQFARPYEVLIAMDAEAPREHRRQCHHVGQSCDAHLQRLLEGLARGAAPAVCIVVEVGSEPQPLPDLDFPVEHVLLDSAALPQPAPGLCPECGMAGGTLPAPRFPQCRLCPLG